jgi:hypothetical protein
LINIILKSLIPVCDLFYCRDLEADFPVDLVDNFRGSSAGQATFVCVRKTNGRVERGETAA